MFGKPFTTLIVLLAFAWITGVCSSLQATPIEQQVSELQRSLEQHDRLLARLQELTAEQARKQGELARIPLAVEDLDTLRREVRVLGESVRMLQDQMADLRQQNKNSKASPVAVVPNHSDPNPLLLGLLALQSGDVNRAVDQLQPLLTSNNSYRKDDLLMVLGNGFLQAGYPEQAASHLSTLIRSYPQSQHLPAALFSLGQAFGDMRDEPRKYAIWKALIEEYPNHPMAGRATRSLETLLR